MRSRPWPRNAYFKDATSSFQLLSSVPTDATGRPTRRRRGRRVNMKYSTRRAARRVRYGGMGNAQVGLAGSGIRDFAWCAKKTSDRSYGCRGESWVTDHFFCLKHLWEVTPRARCKNRGNKGLRGDGSDSGGKQGPKCWVCGKRGHISFNCPDRKGDDHDGDDDDKSGNKVMAGTAKAAKATGIDVADVEPVWNQETSQRPRRSRRRRAARSSSHRVEGEWGQGAGRRRERARGATGRTCGAWRRPQQRGWRRRGR